MSGERWYIAYDTSWIKSKILPSNAIYRYVYNAIYAINNAIGVYIMLCIGTGIGMGM